MKLKGLFISGIGALMMAGALSLQASSLPEYTVTGTVELDTGGKTQVYETTTNTVPNRPGFLVHTATWRIMEPMMIAGMNLAPEGILVHLIANARINKDSSSHIRISFSVDENSYKLIDSSKTVVALEQKNKDKKNNYEDEEPILVLNSAEMDASETLHVQGVLKGVLQPEGGTTTKSLDYEARFDVKLPRHN